MRRRSSTKIIRVSAAETSEPAPQDSEFRITTADTLGHGIEAQMALSKTKSYRQRARPLILVCPAGSVSLLIFAASAVKYHSPLCAAAKILLRARSYASSSSMSQR